LEVNMDNITVTVPMERYEALLTAENKIDLIKQVIRNAKYQSDAVNMVSLIVGEVKTDAE